MAPIAGVQSGRFFVFSRGAASGMGFPLLSGTAASGQPFVAKRWSLC